jgi:hypothetical protein
MAAPPFERLKRVPIDVRLTAPYPWDSQHEIRPPLPPSGARLRPNVGGYLSLPVPHYLHQRQRRPLTQLTLPPFVARERERLEIELLSHHKSAEMRKGVVSASSWNVLCRRGSTNWGFLN